MGVFVEGGRQWEQKEPGAVKPNFVVARKEPCGLLLWSYAKDAYYLVADKHAIDSIDEITQGQTSLEMTGDDVLQKELAGIGFSSDTKFRNISNPPHRHILSAPLDVYFDYTWTCNLKCPDCYNRNVNRKITMPDEKVRHVFKEMATAGIMRTHLAGGEPTIFPERLENYLSAADENHIRTSVNTNGTFFTDKVAEIIFAHDLVSLTFSIDGSTSILNDNLRGTGSYSKTVDGVKKAVEYKNRIGSKTQIQIKTIWEPYVGIDELENMVKLGIDLGSDVVQFHNPERCLYHEKGYFSKHRDEYYERVKAIKLLEEKYRNNLSIWNVCNPLGTRINIGIPGYKGCIGGKELIAINPDGSMAPCLMNPINLGNLFTDWHGSFLNFWNLSEKLTKYQDDSEILDPDCAECKLYRHCRGGSKVRTLVESGIIYQKDPYCPTDYLKDNDREVIDSGDSNILDRRSQSKNTYLQQISVTHSL